MEWKTLETAPRDGTVVLLIGRGMRHADGYWEQAAYNGNGAWIWPYVHCNPTHWMPLPSAPEEGITIAGNGASELGKLMQEQHKNRGPVPHA